MVWLVRSEVYNMKDELCFIKYYDRNGKFRNCKYYNNYNELTFPKNHYLKNVYSNDFENYFIDGFEVFKKECK